MLTGLFHTHSSLRWLVVLAALLLFFRFLMIWTKKGEFSKFDNTLVRVFSGLFDLQILIGIILLLWLGFMGAGWPMHRIEHGVTMLIAAGLWHVSAKWKASPAPVRAKFSLVMLLIACLLIYIAVMRLPQGWQLAPTVSAF